MVDPVYTDSLYIFIIIMSGIFQLLRALVFQDIQHPCEMSSKTYIINMWCYIQDIQHQCWNVFQDTHLQYVMLYPRHTASMWNWFKLNVETCSCHGSLLGLPLCFQINDQNHSWASFGYLLFYHLQSIMFVQRKFVKTFLWVLGSLYWFL